MEWQPIETAPKEIVAELERHQYGAHILAYAPDAGGVVRCRWWQSRISDANNFIADGGRACFPSHWMPLPAPPQEGQG